MLLMRATTTGVSCGVRSFTQGLWHYCYCGFRLGEAVGGAFLRLRERGIWNNNRKCRCGCDCQKTLSYIYSTASIARVHDSRQFIQIIHICTAQSLFEIWHSASSIESLQVRASTHLIWWGNLIKSWYPHSVPHGRKCSGDEAWPGFLPKRKFTVLWWVESFDHW